MGSSGRCGRLLGSACRAVRGAGRTLLLGAFRSVVAGGIAAVGLALSGCYTYVPHPISEVPQGVEVAADITDAGRVALDTQIGSEVARVQGKVIQHSDSTLRLTVSEVQFLSGLSSPWQGQEVILRPQDVKSLSQRTYSKQRTVLAVIAIGGLIVIAIATAVFTGVFSGNSGPDKPGDGNPEG